jgi:hypothetical protein
VRVSIESELRDLQCITSSHHATTSPRKKRPPGSAVRGLARQSALSSVTGGNAQEPDVAE